ncbi:hypothetical protein FQN50_001486 [Emmonsiellopsis sp. PD_5]|nr:hypothetical protein FQN50_001486 [Emmonsiellopsis sp. PD_5]
MASSAGEEQISILALLHLSNNATEHVLGAIITALAAAALTTKVMNLGNDKVKEEKTKQSIKVKRSKKKCPVAQNVESPLTKWTVKEQVDLEVKAIDPPS